MNMPPLQQQQLGGAKPRFRPMNPLCDAAEQGDLPKLTTLIAQRGDVNITGENGNSALAFACANGPADCTSLLLQEHVEPVSSTIKRPRVDVLLAAGDQLRVRLRQHPRAFLELLRDSPPRCDPAYPSRTRESQSAIPEQIPVHVSVTVHCHNLHAPRTPGVLPADLQFEVACSLCSSATSRHGVA